ncbi:MAG: NADH:flavin oxidoreductase [Dehalococcoidia bacterium]|nr:NADH:flavin oxidoreductase [Dehalococcoidia bacterium]
MAALFEKTCIKNMELKNRLVRSATHEGMSDLNGFPEKALFKLYERLAKGGVGLIITGYAFVSRDGNSPSKGMQGIDREEHISAYRELTDHVHQNGAKIAMQVAHCGRQTTYDAIGTQPIGPSPVRDKSLFVTPREMTEEDIERIIEAFGQASRRAKESGFDAVQIHGAHGYLINQFLSPYTNRRKDQWGGSIENRMRFVSEIYHQCRKQVGEEFPILIKINGYDTMKGGLRLDESMEMARMMGKMGFDGIEVSCGIDEDNFSTLRGDLPVEAMLDDWDIYRKKNPVYRTLMRLLGRKIVKPLPFVEAYNLESAKAIKGKVDIPVFLVGGLINPGTMEAVIEREDADYISLSRALIVDVGFPEKIRMGSREPSRCIHCNLCIGYVTKRPLRCYHGKRINKKERPKPLQDS